MSSKISFTPTNSSPEDQPSPIEPSPQPPRLPRSQVSSPALSAQVFDDVSDPAEKARLDNERLDKILAAAGRTKPDLANVWVRSLDTTLVVRELDDREMEDALQAQSGLRNRPQDVRFISSAANIVAKAIVEPNLADPRIMSLIQQRHGEHITSVPEIVKLVIKPLEIIAILEEIMELSGGGEDAVRVAKN